MYICTYLLTVYILYLRMKWFPDYVCILRVFPAVLHYYDCNNLWLPVLVPAILVPAILVPGKDDSNNNTVIVNE